MDQQQINALLDGLPPVEFSMDPANAFALVALLQLAMRHPALTDPLAEVGLGVVDGIRRAMPPRSSGRSISVSIPTRRRS